MPSLVEIEQTTRKDRSRCHAVRSRKLDYTDLLESPPDEKQASGRHQAPGAAADFLHRVQTAAKAPDPDDAIDLIYAEVDALLREGAFGRVDELLGALDISGLPTLLLLAFVSITNAARTSLSARPGFVARLRHHLADVEPGRVEELLAGLE